MSKLQAPIKSASAATDNANGYDAGVEKEDSVTGKEVDTLTQLSKDIRQNTSFNASTTATSINTSLQHFEATLMSFCPKTPHCRQECDNPSSLPIPPRRPKREVVNISPKTLGELTPLPFCTPMVSQRKAGYRIKKRVFLARSA